MTSAFAASRLRRGKSAYAASRRRAVVAALQLRRDALLVTAAFSAALVTMASLPSAVRELQVVGVGDRVAWRGPIKPGETFDLAFTHSQEGGRWVQHYVARDRGIEQRSSSFPSFGAGMPVESADGSAIGHTPQAYTVAAPARIGDLPMMNSDAADITLTYRGHQVSLGVFFDDFERFTIRIR